MNKIIRKRDKGFTLLEILIVIIIIGVLATLALPRFFNTIEFARSIEAMFILSTMKRAADRCAMMGGVPPPDYSRCVTFEALAMDSPGLIPGAHFCYNNPTLVGNVWTARAERNNVDNSGSGNPCNAAGGGTGTGDLVILSLRTDTGVVTRSGTGRFSSIQ